MCNTFRFFTFLGANENLDRLFGRYIESIDGVIFCDGKALSVRKDLNGVLLVDTALQRKLQKPEEKVFLELLLPEVLYSPFLNRTQTQPCFETVSGKQLLHSAELC